MLEHFFLWDDSLPIVPHGHHDPLLVILSVAVAMLSSALALHLAEQTRAHGLYDEAQRRIILATGSLAMGVGIWGMHFIAMLGLHFPVEVSFSLPLTALSLLPGVAASAVALWVLTKPQLSPRRLLLSSVLMALGIGTMHYSGMAAIRMHPLLRYDPLLFVLSLVVAWGLAGVALWVRFGLARLRWLTRFSANTLAAMFMGMAISGMHYTAMQATRLVGYADPDTSANDAWFLPLALAIALITAAISTAVAALNVLMHYRLLYRQVRANEARLQGLVDTAVDSIILIDQDGSIQSFNRAAEGVFGWRAEEVLGRNVNMLMPEPFRTHHDDYLKRYLRTSEPHIIGIGREVVALHKDGTRLPMRLAVGRIDVPEGVLFVGFLMDLRQLKQAEEQLRIAASVFEHSRESIVVLDAQQRIVSVNAAFGQTLEGPDAHAQGQRLADFYPAADFATIWEQVDRHGHWRGELVRANPTGGQRVERMSLAAVRHEDGARQHFVAVISDITQAKAHEQELERIALYDCLTGLPNRRLLLDRMQQQFHHIQRHPGMLAAVCYLDLDGFKQVNDRHGHKAGDFLLIEIGRRIQALLRSEDTLARMGGDEMVLLLGDLAQPEDCQPVLQRILQAIHQPLDLPAKGATVSVQVSGSMGVSFYPRDGDNPDLLLRQSDQAMYLAKQAGKNQYQWFSPPPPASRMRSC